LAVALIVVAGVVACFFSLLSHWRYLPLQKNAATLPQIQTAGLDAAAAGLIQRQIDLFRAALPLGEAWGKLGGVLKSFGFREQAG